MNTKSVEPDQTPRSAASDLSLHCLLLSLLRDSRLKWLMFVSGGSMNPMMPGGNMNPMMPGGSMTGSGSGSSTSGSRTSGKTFCIPVGSSRLRVSYFYLCIPKEKRFTSSSDSSYRAV